MLDFSLLLTIAVVGYIINSLLIRFEYDCRLHVISFKRGHPKNSG
jgi:hypothetical protein